jgi:hypothetical protein
MSLAFNPEDHSYAWEGKPVPGVSAILKETGQAKDWKDVPAYYRDRGIATHAAINLYLKGTLDEESLDPVIVPYFEQFKAWDKQQEMYTPISEQPFYSKRLKYAGTIDLIANGTIYDIKCSKKLDKASTWQYNLQGGAYRTLVLEEQGMTFPFKILLLTGEGEPQVIPLEASVAAWEHVVKLYDFKVGRK